MLSAYMRFKYPNLVNGAIASSAPIYLVSNQSSRDFFFQDVTKDFSLANKQCPSGVKQGFQRIEDLVNSGPSGLQKLTKILRLCKPMTKNRLNHVNGWIRNSLTNLAMFDYPYPTTFLVPVPAYPVKVACSYIMNSSDPLVGLVQAAGLHYNGTKGSLKCFDVDMEFVECADPTGCGVGPDSMAWYYQVY
ncbi:dipeptidyl peptidase 2-like [Saccoglossus kowalevskii]